MIKTTSLDYILDTWTPEIFEIMLPLMAELVTIDLENKPLEKIGNDSCNMKYRTSRGWVITIFNDCGDWDYIDNAVTPDGLSLCEALKISYLGGLADFYEPTRDQLEHIWTDWNGME